MSTVEFARVHAREMLRDGRAVAAVGLSFVALLCLFWGVDALVASATTTSPGLLRRGIPLVALTGFMAIAFVLTLVPLVRYRSTGVLSALATTPAKPGSFLIAHAGLRFALVCAEAATLLVLAHALGVRHTAALAVTLVLGGAMMLSFGYLLAARLANLDVALQLAYLIPMVALATSGALFPLDVLPAWAAVVFRLLPSTWLVEASQALALNSTGGAPVTTWVLMVGTTVAVFAAAVWLHRWRSLS